MVAKLDNDGKPVRKKPAARDNLVGFMQSISLRLCKDAFGGTYSSTIDDCIVLIRAWGRKYS